MNKRPVKALLACTVFALLCAFLCMPFFLKRTKAATCAHQHVQEVPYSYKAPTCTTAGTKQYKCDDCKHMW